MTEGASREDARTTSPGTAGRRRATRSGASAEAPLDAPQVPRPSFRGRAWRYVLIGLVLVLLGGWFLWYATTPEKLATTDKTVSASGVTGAPFYVGMYAASGSFDRTLRISGVKVHLTTNVKMKVTPLLCRRGTVGVTTRPEQFCKEVVNPEGERFVRGDSIVLKIESPEAAIAVVDQLRIAYREDVRWATQPAGARQAIVSIAARPARGDAASS